MNVTTIKIYTFNILVFTGLYTSLIYQHYRMPTSRDKTHYSNVNRKTTIASNKLMWCEGDQEKE